MKGQFVFFIALFVLLTIGLLFLLRCSKHPFEKYLANRDFSRIYKITRQTVVNVKFEEKRRDTFRFLKGGRFIFETWGINVYFSQPWSLIVRLKGKYKVQPIEGRPSRAKLILFIKKGLNREGIFAQSISKKREERIFWFEKDNPRILYIQNKDKVFEYHSR